MLYSANDDPELSEWLKSQTESKSEFVRALVKAAQSADYGQYYLLQPALRRLRAQNPEANSSIRTLTTAACKVVFNDVHSNKLAGAFARLNALAFENSLPHETQVRYAASIQSICPPAPLVGALVEPSDPVSFSFPGQYRVDKPHIFISEKLRDAQPVDDWVLLHEMCHFKVPNHEPEFIEEVKRALDCIGWSVLLGGY